MNGWLEYLKFQLKSKNLHGVHSPFIYDLLEKVILDKKNYPEYAIVENLKKQLIQNSESLSFYDYGANKGEKKTTVRDIASNSGVSKKYGRLLFRLTRWFQPKYVLELGTSLGIGTSYLALGCGAEANIITLEGGEAVARVAKTNFNQLNLLNSVDVEIGSIDVNLERIIQSVPRLDFVYFDANHRLVPTIQYFEACLEKVHSQSVFIFDDINWSKEMQGAWKIIKQHKKVIVTVDLYRFGMVFFNDKQAKEEFILRF
ncbi:MAG: class I SAM-dependent methyltransferase [Bacteroidetes bacterium]|nr:class I SAM-dependent methyltransferase [Bacteroidota bacterium]